MSVDLLLQQQGWAEGWTKAERDADRSQKKMEADAKRAQKSISDEARKAAKDTQEAWSGATAKASADTARMGDLTAKQYAAAMRGVPAQITDIVVSLQGGQRPLTVLLQQGGQLKDMFGGTVPALRALSTGLLGLINPMTLLGAGAVALGAGFLAGRKESQAFQVALETTGRVSGATVGQLNSMSAAMAGVDGITRGRASEALAIFASGAGVGADRLQQYTQTALNWEKATGGAADEVAKNFKKLSEDPVKGIRELDSVMNLLTASTYAQIKALQQSGDATGAARVAQDAYDKASRTAAENINANLGTVERSWNAIVSASKRAIDAVKEVGRQTGDSAELAKTTARIAELQAKGVQLTETPTTYAERDLLTLKQKEVQLQKNLAAERNMSDAAKAARADEKARMDLSDEADKYADKATRKRQELAAAEAKYASLARTNTDAAKQYAAVVAGINDKYKETPATVSKVENSYRTLIASINQKISVQRQDLDQSSKISESQKLSISLEEDLRAKKLQLSNAQADSIRERIAVLKGLEDEAEKVRRAVAAYQEYTAQQAELAADYVAQSKAREEGRAAVSSYAQGIDQANQALRYEISLMGLSEQARETALEQYRIELELKKQIEAIDANSAFNEVQREEQRAKARASAATAMATASSRAFLNDWKKSVSQYDDIFRRGFADMLNNGKDGWASFTKSLVTTFKTTVADQIYKMFVQPIVVQLVGNLMGVGGAAGIAGVAGATGAFSNFGGAALGYLGNLGGFGAGAASVASEAALGSAFMGPSASAAGGLVGAGAAFARALPYIGLAITAISLLSGQDKSGTPHYGAAAEYAGGRVTGDEALFLANRGISGRYSAQAQSGVNAIALGAGAALDAFDRAFGGKGGYNVATAYSDDSSDDPGFGSLRITRNGQKVVDWGDTRTSKWADRIFADGEEGAKMYAAAVAKDVRDAMLGVDLPSWATNLLKEIGDAVSMEQLGAVVQQIALIKTTFETLGNTLVGFADLTDLAQEALMKAAGGIEALAASATTFYQNFYSESERAEISRRQLDEQLAALGVNIDVTDPDAKERYRKLVEDALARSSGEEAARAALTASLEGIVGVDWANVDIGSIVRQSLGENASSEYVDAISQGLTEIIEGGGGIKDLTGSLTDLMGATEGSELTAAELAAALLKLNGAFAESADYAARLAEEERKRIEEERKRAIDSAYDLFTRAVERDLDALGEQASALEASITQIGQAVNLLKTSARELFGSVGNVAQMQAAQGMIYIERALGGLRAGGSLIDYPELADAISAARGGLDAGNYASRFDLERDTLELANQLAEMGVLGDARLSVEERQLKAINAQVELLNDMAKRADELVNGTIALTETVDTYFARLLELLDPSSPTNPAGEGEGGDRVVAGPGGAGPVTTSKYYRPVIVGSVEGRIGVAESENARLDVVAGIASQYAGTGDLEGLFTAVRAAGGTISDLSAVLGFYEADLRNAASSVGIPAFAVGTNYVPRDMLALIHEGEAIVPKAYNPYAGGDDPAATSGMAQIAQQSLDVARAILSRVASMNNQLVQWDVDGLPETRDLSV